MTSAGKDAYSIERSVLNWKDSAGNTILHIAVLIGNKQAFDFLRKVVRIDAKNLENQTALDLAEARHLLSTRDRTLLNVKAKLVSNILVNNDFNGEITLKKSEFFLIEYILTSGHRITAQISEEQRNAYMVVGTLIATAIYQTVLSPPGGLTQAQGSDNNNLVNATSSLNSTAAGKIVMPHKVYSVVKSLNACIFVGGVIIIYLLMPKPSHVFSSLACMLLLIFIASYFVSESVISP
ncbi:ankyrin repeat-containing protein BDA1-like [Arachis stenosperma]|uniref:ankyrin repeat-containing protein BDA1-like n=1 Tax=Arachis stenosperma TaxID=217475 RepID=UPI0025AC9A98|nr:ankyrin repeat-containing protein BDA1-like [Arachis stenosperma]